MPYEESDLVAIGLVASTPYVFVVHPEFPAKGFGELSGRVPMMFENLAVMTPHIRKGTLRPLAVSSLKRTHLMPEVPTVAETGMGLEGFEVLGWFALLAPAKTPSSVVQLLNAELNRMVAKPLRSSRNSPSWERSRWAAPPKEQRFF